MRVGMLQRNDPEPDEAIGRLGDVLGDEPVGLHRHPHRQALRAPTGRSGWATR